MSILISILYGGLGVLMGIPLIILTCLIYLPILRPILRISERPGGPGERLTNIALWLFTVVLVAIASTAAVGAWFAIDWASARYGFTHGKAMLVGVVNTLAYVLVMGWAFGGGGFGNACSMADSEARRQREWAAASSLRNVAEITDQKDEPSQKIEQANSSSTLSTSNLRIWASR